MRPALVAFVFLAGLAALSGPVFAAPEAELQWYECCCPLLVIVFTVVGAIVLSDQLAAGRRG